MAVAPAFPNWDPGPPRQLKKGTNLNGIFAAVAGLLAAAFFPFPSSKDPTNILYSLTAPHQRELIRTAAEFGDTTNQNYLMSAGGFATAVETRCAPSAAPIPPTSSTCGMQMDLNPEADHHTSSEPNPNGVFAAVAGLLAAAFFSFSSSKDLTKHPPQLDGPPPAGAHSNGCGVR